jgi:hypothetical protein
VEPLPAPLNANSKTNPVMNNGSDLVAEAARTRAADSAMTVKFQKVTSAPPARSASHPPAGRARDPRSGLRKVRQAALTGVLNW